MRESDVDPQSRILRASVVSKNDTDEWATIDWLNSENNAADATRRRKLATAEGTRKINAVFSSSQGLWSAIVVGCVLGFLGVVCEASTHFVVNFRIGICVDYFWLGKEQCCAGGDEDCEEFRTWGQYFGTNPRHQAFTDYIFYVFWTTTFAMTAAVFCKFYNVYAAGGGINEVKTIVSGHQKARYLGGWTLCTKALAMCFSTGSGLAIGKEGPFVHIGSCVGYVVSRIFPDYNRHESKRRELIAAGAAGGIAVAFGAPIGGVLFSLEEISSFLNFKALLQALIAGIVSLLIVKRVDMFHTGRIVQFSINYTHAWHWFELPIFALIGVIGGLVGCFFNVSNIQWIRVRKANFGQWKVTEICILGIITGTLNYMLPYCKTSMLELLGDLFQDCTTGSTLDICQDGAMATTIYLILGGTMKLVLCILTVGTAVPAGLLVPSLCVGAMYGRALGLVLDGIQKTYPDSFLFTECFEQGSCVIPGAYAIVASAATLTGVTRMTISLAVIMFELTGGLEYLVPVIIAILCSKATADAFGIESIFELGIEENNFPYLDPKKEFFHEAYAFDINERRAFKVIHSTGWSFRDLNDLLERSTCSGFPVVVSPTDQTLLGYISSRELKGAMMETAITKPHNVDANTKVRFCANIDDSDVIVHHARNKDSVTSSPTTSTAAPVPTGASASAPSNSSTPLEDANDNDESTVPLELDYTRYVNSSVLQVEPYASVQFLLSLFKALGNRMVIVTRYSKFEGIITKKDLIAFMRKIEHEHH